MARLTVTVFFLSIGLLLATQSLAATLTASVDRTKISVEETVTLRVKYDNSQVNTQPDFSQLESQFEVLSIQPRSQYSNMNGRIESYVQWLILLAPKEEGKALIPSFKIGNSFSEAIEIEVTAAQAVPPGMKQDVFIETLVDKSSVYVQEQIRLTYRLYFSVNVDSQNVDPLNLENAIVEDLETTQYRKNINGKTYIVAEFNYAIFPQTSGEINIPARRWKVNVAPGNIRNAFRMGRYKVKNLRTDSKLITVKPKPAQFPAGQTWLPASDLKLSESWSKEVSDFKIGEPLTRTLTLQAQGLMSSQLPQIYNDNMLQELPDGMKFYADQPRQNDAKTIDTVKGERSESAAIVISSAGLSNIPSVRIPWWDVDEDKLKYAEIENRSVVIAADPNAVDTQQNDTIPSSQVPAATGQIDESILLTLRIWQIAAISFALLSIIFIILWWQARGRRSETSAKSSLRQNALTIKERSAYNQLKSACRENKLSEIRTALLNWAKVYWQDNSIQTLDEIARRIDHPSTKTQILALDATLFGASQDSSWNGNLLYTSLSEWYENRKASQQEQTSLQPLYQ